MNNNRKYNRIISEIDTLIVNTFDKHLKDKKTVTIDSECNGDIMFCISTLDNQDYYDFFLTDLIKKDCFHDKQDWIDKLELLIQKLKEES